MNGPFNFAITIYFGSINPYKNNDRAQQMFIKDLVINICKGFWALFNTWKHLIMKVNFMLVSPSFISFSYCSCEWNVFYNGKKNLNLQVVPKLVSIAIVFASFILWKSKGIVDILNALVINFLNESWTPPMHVIAGIFEVNEING